MLKGLFEEKIYVKVAQNRFEIMNVSGNPALEIVSPPEPFSTSRLLIGEFSRAEQELRRGIRKVLPQTLLKRSSAVLMHPVEMTEGGLSEVEIKVLREVALGAGAHRVELWQGAELSPGQAARKLDKG